MKKLFLVLSILIFVCAHAFAQDETAESSSETNTLKGISPYAPSFDVLRATDDLPIEKDFERLQTNLVEIRDDYLFRIMYKVDLILAEYTNDRFIDTNNAIFGSVFYYDLVARPMASDDNVTRGLTKLEDGFNLYRRVEPLFKALGKTNELQTADYELNLYGGILNLYKGSDYNLYKSLNHFNYIIDNRLIPEDDKETLVMVNTYLAGINQIVAKKQYNDVMRRHYYNRVFDNLWDLTTLKTEDEAIRNAKYQILINTYFHVIDTRTVRFRTIYKSHFDRLGFTYAKTEDEILSREVQPIYKDSVSETPPPAN